MSAMSASRPQRVAVVGSGIAGLSAAYTIAKHGGDQVRVALYEKNDKIGGHAHTHTVGGKYPDVDVGFMVMNHTTYPNLLKLFAELQVPLEPTDMSFCVSQLPQDGERAKTWSFGYNWRAWLRMLPTPRFWRWLYNMNRFHREALAALEASSTEAADVTIRDWLQQRGYDESVVDGWLVPFCAAVWSSPSSAAGDMNARALFVFLRNHGFLKWAVPAWVTPRRRCAAFYLRRLQQWFDSHGVEVHTSQEVVRAAYADGDSGAIELQFAAPKSGTREAPAAEPRVFDQVVFATPAGKANKMVAALQPRWGSFVNDTHLRSHTSEVVLHSDPVVMPHEKCWWAAWTVKGNTFTYYLNMLQLRASPGAPQMFETLNPPPELKIDQSKVHARWTMQHPVMDKRTLDAQRMYTQATAAAPGCGRRLAAGAAVAGAGTRAQQQVSNRNNRVWLAGAYLHHGFHEDGCRSGIEAARCVLGDPSIPLLRVPFGRLHPKHTVFRGHTTHARLRCPTAGAEAADAFATTRNKFKYAHTLDCVDIDGGPRYWWGGLYREDHFGDPDVPLGECVRRAVAAETGEWPLGPIELICGLRAYGYCMNPISFFCVWSAGDDDDATGAELQFLVTEVASTPWEQRVVHVLDLRTAGTGSERVFTRMKTIHVSPFNPTPDGDQRWEYVLHELPGDQAPGQSRRLHVTVKTFLTAQRQRERKPKIIATLDVTECDRQHWLPPLPHCFIAQLRIHWQAIVLAWKGLPFVPNTSWSSSATDPRASAQQQAGCCPLGFGYAANALAGGPSGRTSPMFLERAAVSLFWLALLAATCLGYVSFTPAVILAVLSYVMLDTVCDLIGRVLPPDVTGRHPWA